MPPALAISYTAYMAILIALLLICSVTAATVLAAVIFRSHRLAADKRAIQQQADQRTAELLETNRLLRQEIASRAAVEESLRRSEAIARGMFETAVDAIITIDTQGIMTSFNPAAERLFGYSASEALGRNVSILMPQPFAREHDAHIQRYLQTNKPRIIGIGREVVGRRKNGTTFPMDLAVGEQKLSGPGGDGKEERIFTGFVRDLTERKRLEAEVLQIAEREQQRIGQDLHDGLGQHLTGLAFLAKGLAARLAEQQLPAAADAEKINDLLNHAVSQTRALARGLQPLADPSELPLALEQLCESVRNVFVIDCTVNATPVPSLKDLTVATHLYRIAQEAVNNAIRHGKAKGIGISLRETDNGVRLMVQDDGGGFGPISGTGIGLRIMQYRARAIDATLDVSPGASAGAVVTCQLEFSPSQRESVL